MTAELDSRSDLTVRGVSVQAADGTPVPEVSLRRTRWVEERPLLGKIGRYTVLGQIAGGGMGSVFVAQMRGPAQFSRLVAIKCLHTRWLDDPKYVARFTTEVKLSTLIRHPNVVQTLDVVEDGGELFLVMEYVDGVTLAALLADLNRVERSLPIDLALGIMAAVLRGLQAAHEATDEKGVACHIVHRDVSPQNIMVSRSGHVQVLDFGAAKAADHSQHTAAGVLVGKLAYMAPEQVRGERSSPRTDVFAAGVVLWEALVGKRLFFDPALGRNDLLHALVLKPVARPSTLRPGVPRAVDDVVRKALDRNPERRYQTALEFATALDAAGASAVGANLGQLVLELCAPRLADKDALLRTGLAAAAEASASTPLPHALVLPTPESFPGLALASSRPALRRSRAAWLGATALVGASIWWSTYALRSMRFRESPIEGQRSLAAPVDPIAIPAPSVGEAPHVAAAAANAPLLAPAPSAGVIELPPVLVASEYSAGVGSAPAKVRRAVPSRAARNASARAPRSRRAGPDCDPPTYTDSAGIRHFKKDCL